MIAMRTIVQRNESSTYKTLGVNESASPSCQRKLKRKIIPKEPQLLTEGKMLIPMLLKLEKSLLLHENEVFLNK